MEINSKGIPLIQPTSAQCAAQAIDLCGSFEHVETRCGARRAVLMVALANAAQQLGQHVDAALK